MPRFGKDFKMYNRILPSLALDVAPILNPTSSCNSQHSLQAQNPPKCLLCNISAAVVTCEECVQVWRVDKVFLCAECSKLTHKTRRHNSICELSQLHKLSFPMDLLSVICIETSHYVCFTRCEDRWLFHDSMADRICKHNVTCECKTLQSKNLIVLHLVFFVFLSYEFRLCNRSQHRFPRTVQPFLINYIYEPVPSCCLVLCT